ncbi:MAG: PKD domain-containing protein, partial [bacterium]
MLRYTFFTIIVLAALMVSACSSRNGVITSPTDFAQGQTQSVNFGEFKIIPNADLSGAEIVPVRDPQLDVTKWADVKITGSVWDPVLRNWTLTVKVTNPTQFMGFGVQARFTDLGGKEMRWPDGFVWTGQPPTQKRIPFFAIEKSGPGREFPGFHFVICDLTFHFPNGIDKWLPISFYLDANIGGPRGDPMVEDMAISYFPPPCQHSTITARIDDHQSLTSDLDVWTDLTQIGGSDHEPLFDDGEHADGVASDGIFGVDFNGGIFGQLYSFTVYAKDPEGNMSENDILYSPISYPPLPPIDFETMFIGPLCMLTEEALVVIKDSDTWNNFWDEFSPWDMPTPVIDFTKKMVIAVCIGERPDDCYSVKIESVDWSGLNCGWAVKYTETYPGPNCKCGDMVTTPYHLIMLNTSAFNIMFQGDMYEDPCSGGQDEPVALAKASPNPQTVCEQVDFSDDGSYDPDGGSIIKYEWDWENDGIFDEEGVSTDHSWQIPGTYWVQFRVTDDEGESDQLDNPLEIVIENALPTAVASADNYSPKTGDEINFDASLSFDNDCNGESISNYEWDWDYDGDFVADETGVSPIHSYSSEGTYYVMLRVTDDEGEWAMLDEPLEITVSQNPCLDLVEVASGAFGIAESQTTSVITNQTEWESWWASSVGGGTPPAIDFDKYMLFGATMGTHSTSGYFVTVDSACIDLTEQLEIIVGYHIPGPTCMVLMVFTWPYAVYKAEKVGNPYFWTTYD